MNSSLSNFGLALTAFAVALIAYLGGYFWIVRPRPLSPFITWNGRPLSLQADYRIDQPVVKSICEPLVRLDRHIRPWLWQQEPPLAARQAWTNSMSKIDLERVHNEAKRRANAETAHLASVTVTVSGRVIKTSADVPAVIDTQDDDYTITFGNHEVRVEKERLLLDDKEAAKIPASATNVTVVVSDATLSVAADSSNIVTTNITR